MFGPTRPIYVWADPTQPNLTPTQAPTTTRSIQLHVGCPIQLHVGYREGRRGGGRTHLLLALVI